MPFVVLIFCLVVLYVYAQCGSCIHTYIQQCYTKPPHGPSGHRTPSWDGSGRDVITLIIVLPRIPSVYSNQCSFIGAPPPGRYLIGRHGPMERWQDACAVRVKARPYGSSTRRRPFVGRSVRVSSVRSSVHSSVAVAPRSKVAAAASLYGTRAHVPPSIATARRAEKTIAAIRAYCICIYCVVGPILSIVRECHTLCAPPLQLQFVNNIIIIIIIIDHRRR